MTPPIDDSVTASTRNWSSTSRSSAPIARRVPISRVRSVIDTSMMFMMPMPPTSRLTAATAPSSVVSSCVVPVMVRAISRVSSTLKLSSTPSPMRRRSRIRLLHGGLDPVGSAAVADGQLDLADVVAAGDAPVQRAQRHQHRVVLVAAHRRLALRLQQADHLARELLHADGAADGIGGAEELRAHRLADDADRRAGLLLGLREGPAGGERPVADRQVVGGRAGDGRGPVLRHRHHGDALALLGATARRPLTCSRTASASATLKRGADCPAEPGPRR